LSPALTAPLRCERQLPTFFFASLSTAAYTARAMPRRARNDASDAAGAGDDDEGHDGAGAGASSSAAAAAPVVKGSLLPKLMRSVVKVFATHAKPNFSLPWQMKQPVKSTSSGFVIAAPGGGGAKLIVTNAHSVSYATTLQVRLQGTSEKVLARILTVAHDCDLALLTVDEPGFWKAAPALELGSLPFLHDEVIVVGYPLGGEQISITAGVVSRLDYGTYAASSRDHLVVQVDSAINGGNSGGPVFDTATGKVVGVAFQALEKCVAREGGRQTGAR
jgi:S1-C subfamily serine protease